MAWCIGGDHETSHEEVKKAYLALDGEFVAAKDTHDEITSKKSRDRDRNVYNEGRRGEIHCEKAADMSVDCEGQSWEF